MEQQGEEVADEALVIRSNSEDEGKNFRMLYG
jgi:hypothetical protein